MNPRWGFHRRTAVLLLFLVHLSSCSSLSHGGFALSELGDRLVRGWNSNGGEEADALPHRNNAALQIGEARGIAYRRMLKVASPYRDIKGMANQRAQIPSHHRSSSSSSQSSPLNRVSTTAPSPSAVRDVPFAVNRPVVVPAPEKSPSVVTSPPASTAKKSTGSRRSMVIMVGVLGSASVLLVSAIAFVFFRTSKVVTVKPWATGLSGQLQKAFVTGVPKLNRSEIVAACEDFSNIIGNFSEGTVYKGTLSSGVEIAVTSSAVKSRADWSITSEEKFRKKIEKLSKVNHKNFVNLIGFCEEEEPFTRIMVFEYAPNGTLFEHLHIKEAEHLDWVMRLRIAMGMAYCLDHMHQITPPIAVRDLNSSSVYLTEDYAGKISDFRFWNEMTAEKMQPDAQELSEFSSDNPESNVYSFGAILFEMITGKMPNSEENSSIKAENFSRDMVDPTLNSINEQDVEKLIQVIRECMHPEPKERPSMADVTARMRGITAVGPDAATPKLSPLWWAELEIISSEGS